MSTRREVLKAWRALDDALQALEAEHGSPLVVYVGSGETVCDRQKLGAWHDPGPKPDQDEVIVMHLPNTSVKWEGGDW